MPTYEYVCSGCGKKFSAALSFADHDKGKAACPKCGGKRLVQQFSAVFTKTSRKS